MPTPINISASRGAAILGLSNWQTQLQIWLQIMESREPGFCAKHNYELPVIEYSPAMRWGHAFESAIIELATWKLECERIFDREKLFCYPLSTFITCHIDGMYNMLIDGMKPLHEGKTTSAFYYKDHFGEPGTDKVPVEYQIQCQHQMICTGAEKVILSVLVFPRRVEEWEEIGWHPENDNGTWIIFTPQNMENIWGRNGKCFILPEQWAESLDQMGYFHQYEINADLELHKMMIEHYTEFWQKNVIEKIMPEPKSYNDIKAICREPVGTIIVDQYYRCNDCEYISEEKFDKCPKCLGFNIYIDSIIERKVSEYKNTKSEISDTGRLGNRVKMLRVEILDYMRKKGMTAVDKDSTDKWILRDRAGRKIASYGKDKRGIFVFR